MPNSSSIPPSVTPLTDDAALPTLASAPLDGIGASDGNSSDGAALNSEEEALTSPQEIDTRRALHSVARARQLAERGELPAAILSCRQAIALVPDLFEAHALHGDLLERAGDRKGAAVAYEKALAIEPDSTFERNALERLQQKEHAAGGLFVANETALLGSDGASAPRIDAKLPPTESASAVTGTAVVGGSVAGAAVAATLPPAEFPASENVDSLPWSESPSEAESGAETTNFEALDSSLLRADVLPSHTRLDATPNPEPGAPSSGATAAFATAPVPVVTPVTSAATRATSPAPLNFQFEPPARAAEPLWARYFRSPSLYTRTLPLAAVAVLGLGTLLWARSRAVETAPANSPLVVDATNDFEPTQGTASGETNVVNPVANPNPIPPSAPGGFPISNQAPNANSGAAPAANNAVAPASANSPAVANRNVNSSGNGSGGSAPRRSGGNAAAPRDSRRVASRPVPRFPSTRPSNSRPTNSRPLLPPAAIPPAAPSRENNESESPLVLPRPRVSLPAPGDSQDAPVRALPPGGNSPLNPSGASDRGYIRVREGRVGTGVLPARPDNDAREEERASNTAARSGQTDAAITRLNAAISADPNDGFRFQQRATLFMERGDFRRAADDFQSAVSAYQNQIERGEQVAQARAGLRAARSGLNLALSRAR